MVQKILLGVLITFFFYVFIELMLLIDGYKETLTYWLYKDLKPHFKTYKTMKFNIKAFKYAMQYVAYPTLFFCLLVFLWFLDIKIMYDWITNKEGFPAFCRIIIFFIEIFVFYKAYVNRIEEINKEERAKELGLLEPPVLTKNRQDNYETCTSLYNLAPFNTRNAYSKYNMEVYDKTKTGDDGYYYLLHVKEINTKSN